MTTSSTATISANLSATMLVWTNRAIESLWLLAAALIPIAFLDRDYVVSEAVISYVEVPKIAMLHTLAGLMAILWLIEWGVEGRLPLWDNTTGEFSWPRPSTWPRRLLNWPNGMPTRWLVLAVWFFLGSTVLSTVLSGSFNVSLWGEVPGQDGYSAYTVAAYVMLFAAIATHLKTKRQLWRLLGAVVFTGVIVSGIGVLQHFGHDPFNLGEPTGGGSDRATSTTGNSIFTAAVLMMTIPLSLAAAVMTVPDLLRTPGRVRENAGLWLLGFSIIGFWVVVLTIQLLGITFTLSRGPWIGALLALGGSLGLMALFAGWGSLGRATVLFGIAAAFTLAVVQWNISISSLGLYLVAIVALVVLIGLAAVVGWRTFGRLAMISGLVVTIYAAVVWLPSWFDDRTTSAQLNPPAAASGFGQTAVARRAASINTYVTSGFFSGRGDTWKRSGELISERPWFEFDELSVRWLRPLIGYGPDLFRNTYLLKSTPQEGPSPVEPDHAHNFFIHQTVEQGLFGLLSSVGLFLAVFLVGTYQLLWKRHSFTLLHKLILVGVLATLAGRFLEMMVGLARVSDLTVLWVLLAIFVILPVVFGSEEVEEVGRPRPQPCGGRRRNNRRLGVSLGRSTLGWPLFWRLAIAAWLVGGIGMLTWVKSINYVRAAVEIGNAVEEFGRGENISSLASLDRAIDLAPDVAAYYNYRSQIYHLYQLDDRVTPERECSVQRARPYKTCLAIAAFESNLEGIRQRPFYYRSRLALANSAFDLRLYDEAIRLYREVASMVPNSLILQTVVATNFNDMAEAHLNEGEPEQAIQVLEQTADFEMDTANFAKALYLQGVAYDDLGQLERSAQFLERSLELVSEGETTDMAHSKLTEIYTKLGKLQLAEEHRAKGQN